MQLNEYLREDESVAIAIPAYDSVDALSPTSEGTLACTASRLVYIRDDTVVDIALSGVDAIEYTGVSFPRRYLQWGGLLLGLAGVVAALGVTLSEIVLSRPLTAVVVILLLAGVAQLVLGYLPRRGTLRVHIARTSYDFASTDGGLDRVAHSIRGFEAPTVDSRGQPPRPHGLVYWSRCVRPQASPTAPSSLHESPQREFRRGGCL